MAKKLTWQTFAGRSYAAYTGGLNGRETYTIDPLLPDAKNPSWVLKYFGVPGWQNLGTFHRLNSAKKAASNHFNDPFIRSAVEPFRSRDKNPKKKRRRKMKKNPKTLADRTVNGIRVRKVKVFKEGDYWRWRITDERGITYSDGGNFMEREQAEHSLNDAFDPPRQNPKALADRTAEASGRFKVLIGSAIFARKGSGPRMHFDGRKFTTNGRPKFFRSQDSAVHVARDLAATHARILRDYAITVEAMTHRGKA